MEIQTTKIINLYEGYEGEPGYFFIATDEKGNIFYDVKAWEGFLHNIFLYNPNNGSKSFKGLTKLIQEDILNDLDFPLDNYYKIPDNNELLDDLKWYKTNMWNNLGKEEQTLLDALTKLTKCAIDNKLIILVANDEA